MGPWDLKDDPYLRILRPLVEAYQAIFEVGDKQIRSMGLTPPQFDVLAELGGTEGLTAAELSTSTLLAKASLTGIIDRMESKGLVIRHPVPGDRRATTIRLTPRGESLYRKAFPAQSRHIRPFFQRALSKQDISTMIRLLHNIRDSFRNHDSPSHSRLKQHFAALSEEGTKSQRHK